MPSSMTGFGRGSADGKRRRYVVEVRSVNNRFCEVRVSTPKDFLELEHQISQRVRETFGRGKFDVVLKVEQLKTSAAKSYWEEDVAQTWKNLDRVRSRLKLSSPVSLEAAITAVRMNSSNMEEFDANAGKMFLAATEKAFSGLRVFRNREGSHLSKDISQRATLLDRAVSKIMRKSKEGQEARVNRLRARLQELLGGDVDSKRIEAETAVLVDRADVSEEIVRLRSHIQRLKQLVSSNQQIGREIDFLLQEMNREINTIGSKSTELEVVNYVVQAKAEIEKIREQAQNIE